MRFSSIQALRAVAAFGVVVFHVLPDHFGVGAAGVDIFFVISGFIMGSVGAREEPAPFLKKRLIRIVPLYWLVTLAMCAGSLIPGVFQRFTFDLPSLVQSLLFIPYADPSGHLWPLVVSGWTLNDEMFFYLLFAIGLACRQPILFTSAVIVTLAVAGLFLRLSPPILLTWTDPILLEFVAGLLLSRGMPVRGAAGGLALLLSGCAGFLLWASLGPVGPRVVVWGLPAFAMVAGAVAIERAGRWPRLRLVELAGDASYSIYLLHGIVIDAVRKAFHVGVAIQLPITLVICVLVSYASYRLIELPAARALRSVGPTPFRMRRAA